MSHDDLTRHTGWALAYMAMMLVIILIRLLPLDTGPAVWPRPDVMQLVTLAIAARRPRYAPVWSIAAVFLLADFLFQQPPGLGALLMVLASETLRTRSEGLRAGTFWEEWLSVALILLALLMAQRALLGLLMIPLPPLIPSALATGLSIVLYPVLTGALGVLLGVRRRAPGEVDHRGQRL